MSKKELVRGIGIVFIVVSMGLYFTEHLINTNNPNVTIQIICIIAVSCIGFPLAIIGSCMKHEKTVEKYE